MAMTIDRSHSTLTMAAQYTRSITAKKLNLTHFSAQYIPWDHVKGVKRRQLSAWQHDLQIFDVPGRNKETINSINVFLFSTGPPRCASRSRQYQFFFEHVIATGWHVTPGKKISRERHVPLSLPQQHFCQFMHITCNVTILDDWIPNMRDMYCSYFRSFTKENPKAKNNNSLLIYFSLYFCKIWNHEDHRLW